MALMKKDNLGLEDIWINYLQINQKHEFLKKGKVTLIASRPLIGKTLLATEIALCVARQGKRVLYLSTLKQSRTDIELRMISKLSRVHLDKICNWDMSDSEWNVFICATSELRRLPITCCPAFGISDIKKTCRDIEKLLGLDLVIVDDLDSVRNYLYEKGLTPDEKMHKLKKIAKKRNVPVIVLTRLCNRVENRKNNRPRKKDLLDIGITEKYWDYVLFLYRPDFYTYFRGDTGYYYPFEINIYNPSDDVGETLNDFWINTYRDRLVEMPGSY